MNAKRIRDAGIEDRTVIPFPNACAPLDIDQQALSEADRALLEAARWWVIKSKLIAKAVIDEACFLLARGIPAETSAYATAFLRLVDIHAKRQLRFFAVGTEAVTDDERWFLQLINAAKAGDDQSVDTLLAWRLEVSARRRAGFLINELAQLLQKNDLENGENVVI